MRVSELAREIGVTRQAVDAAIKRIGVKPRIHPEGGWRVLNDRQVAQVREAMRLRRPGPIGKGAK